MGDERRNKRRVWGGGQVGPGGGNKNICRGLLAPWHAQIEGSVKLGLAVRLQAGQPTTFDRLRYRLRHETLSQKKIVGFRASGIGRRTLQGLNGPQLGQVL